MNRGFSLFLLIGAAETVGARATLGDGDVGRVGQRRALGRGRAAREPRRRFRVADPQRRLRRLRPRPRGRVPRSVQCLPPPPPAVLGNCGESLMKTDLLVGRGAQCGAGLAVPAGAVVAALRHAVARLSGRHVQRRDRGGAPQGHRLHDAHQPHDRPARGPARSHPQRSRGLHLSLSFYHSRL